jgi:UTP--glucose-1-phosphate uridylyltransferase
MDHVMSHSGIEKSRIHFVEQYEAYRLTPDNQISFVDDKPELYPCGHGDLFPALVQSGLIENFVAEGGLYISIVNVDNVAASLDPVTIGRHIDLQANVSCEVVRRAENDSGGVLCNVGGTLQIVEGFRISGVDPRKFEWLNTNSFIINARLNISPLGAAWNRVQKNIENRVVVQYERLLQEITEAYDTKYLAVERQERFMPIKKVEDLIAIGEKLDINRRYF